MWTIVNCGSQKLKVWGFLGHTSGVIDCFLFYFFKLWFAGVDGWRCPKFLQWFFLYFHWPWNGRSHPLLRNNLLGRFFFWKGAISPNQGYGWPPTQFFFWVMRTFLDVLGCIEGGKGGREHCSLLFLVAAEPPVHGQPPTSMPPLPPLIHRRLLCKNNPTFILIHKNQDFF